MVASSKLTTSYTTRHKNEVGVITCVITPTLLNDDRVTKLSLHHPIS